MRLIDVYVKLEERENFAQGRPIPVNKIRPACIQDWIQRARDEDFWPSLTFSAHAEQFWPWWVSLQPSWRDVTLSQAPLREQHRPDAVGRDWGKLRTTGVNGFFSVLAYLGWWCAACGNDRSGLEAWEAAVSDVVYVVSHL